MIIIIGGSIGGLVLFVIALGLIEFVKDGLDELWDTDSVYESEPTYGFLGAKDISKKTPETNNE